MKKFYKNDFFLFLFIHFMVWSVIPLLRRSLPMDSIEAIMWGRYCDWGTNKHPPLSGFPAAWFYDWFGNWGIYLLSQVCILVGFIFIYKIACCFIEKKKAVLSVMLLEGVIYYGFSSLEYNVNVLSLALWPLLTYYFYLALKENKLIYWGLTGVFAGLNILNKYVSGILLLCMALYMLFTPQGRAKFKTVGPYLTFIVFIAIITPHVMWLYHHNCYVLDYFIGRAAHQASETLLWEIMERFYFPIKFLASQILFGLLTLIVFYLAYRKSEKENATLNSEDKSFLLYMGGAPILLFALISFLLGMKMKSMWGFPVLYMLGILLFVYFPFKLSEKLYHQLKKSAYILMVLFSIAALSVIIFNRSEKINFQGPEFAQNMIDIWKKRTNTDLAYAGGEIWYIANVSLYGKDNPKPVAEMKPEHNPWFSEQDIMEKGVLVIFPDKTQILNLREKYKNMSLPYEYKLEFKNRAGKLKEKTIYYGFLKPEKKHD